jgi:hypothetical protein
MSYWQSLPDSDPTLEALVPSHFTSYEICGGKSGSGRGHVISIPVSNYLFINCITVNNRNIIDDTASILTASVI